MRSYWKLVPIAVAIYGLQFQVDSRALPESSVLLAGRDVSSATARSTLPYDLSALNDRVFGDLEKNTVLLGREPVAPPRIGGGRPHGSGHGHDTGDSVPSSKLGDSESALPRIGDDDGAGSSTASESYGPARIAGDQSSDHPANPPSGLAALEGAATDVIQIMKGVPEFSEGQIAIIGGMAVMKYLPGYRTTKDVDFVVTIKNAPKSVKTKLLGLPDSPFEQRADYTYYKPQFGDPVQIDMVSDMELPYLPSTAKQLSTIGAGDPLPYIEPTDLLVYKIYSCGLRPTPDQKTRDATDAAQLLKSLTQQNRPLTLNDQQKKAANDGLEDVTKILGQDTNDWKTQLGL